MDDSKQFHRALNLAYFYLKFRDRTKQEIINYLRKKAERFDFTEDTIDQVVADLEEHNLLDDVAFTQKYVEARGKAKPKGERALRAELQRLGVSRDILDEYFSAQPLDQSSQAAKALASRWRQFEHLDPRRRFEKAASFLSRRGFSFEIIKKTIAEREGKE